jgi:hypothetical protein
MSDISLSSATVQQIQLELIRRRRFNEFDGSRIAASIERHCNLWLAAYLDRFGVYREEHPDWIPAMSLIKLRDLPHNIWNVDTLIVLSESIDHTRKLEEISNREEWCANEVIVQDDEEEVSMALGMAPCPYSVLTAWWD